MHLYGNGKKYNGSHKSGERMKQTALLTKENQMTLFLLAKVNDDILTNGLTADNLQDLEELQFDLLQIIQKFAKIL